MVSISPAVTRNSSLCIAKLPAYVIGTLFAVVPHMLTKSPPPDADLVLQISSRGYTVSIVDGVIQFYRSKKGNQECEVYYPVNTFQVAIGSSQS